MGGLKGLLHNVWIAARCPWEAFHGGDWKDICSQAMVDPRRPDSGAKAEKDRRTLTIRIAQWMQLSKPIRDSAWKGEEQEAYEHFKFELQKYFDMGQRSNRGEHA